MQPSQTKSSGVYLKPTFPCSPARSGICWRKLATGYNRIIFCESFFKNEWSPDFFKIFYDSGISVNFFCLKNLCEIFLQNRFKFFFTTGSQTFAILFAPLSENITKTHIDPMFTTPRIRVFSSLRLPENLNSGSVLVSMTPCLIENSWSFYPHKGVEKC